MPPSRRPTGPSCCRTARCGCWCCCTSTRSGFTPVQLAWLFLLYEVAGIVTNLAAGWLAARFGLAATLYAGLALQIGALVALAQLDPGLGRSRPRSPSSWRCRASRAWPRTSPRCPRRSAVKLLAPKRGRRPVPLGRAADRIEERGEGARLLSRRGAAGAGRVRGGGLGHGGGAGGDPGRGRRCSCPPGLPRRMQGRGSAGAAGGRRTRGVNRLSASRGCSCSARATSGSSSASRSISSRCCRTARAEGRRAAFFLIGGFMALWIIAYGAVQAVGARACWAARTSRMRRNRAPRPCVWAGLLVPIPFALARRRAGRRRAARRPG